MKLSTFIESSVELRYLNWSLLHPATAPFTQEDGVQVIKKWSIPPIGSGDYSKFNLASLSFSSPMCEAWRWPWFLQGVLALSIWFLVLLWLTRDIGWSLEGVGIFSIDFLGHWQRSVLVLPLLSMLGLAALIDSSANERLRFDSPDSFVGLLCWRNWLGDVKHAWESARLLQSPVKLSFISYLAGVTIS